MTPDRNRAVDGVLIVGADVGATKVAVYEVVPSAQGEWFEPGAASAVVVFPKVAGFRPLPMAEQELQASTGELDLAPGEREQARIWVDETATCVAAVASTAGRRGMLLGVAAPGRKSPDGTGTVVVRNGPRIPDFAELLERRVRRLGVELLAPVEPLLSDGVCGCVGEARSSFGGLFDVQNGYYLAGGTGVAEAVLLGGRAWALDAPHVGLRPAHELTSDAGEVYEDLVSMRAIRERSLHPVERARTIADLLFRRIESMAAGACVEPIYLERITLAQRLGEWLSGRDEGAEVRVALGGELARRIADVGPVDVAAHYLAGDELDPDLIVTSELREAPAIGAAARAWWRFAGTL